MAYAIRLTPREDTQDESNLKKALDKIGGAHVAAREYATNMHIHVLIYTDKDSKYIRNQLTNTLGKTGNGVISVKVAPKPQDMLAYICKGTATHPQPRGEPPDIIWRYGIEVSDIEAAHEAYWAKSKTIKETPGLAFHTQVEYYMKQNGMEFTSRNIATALVKMTIAKKNQLNEHFLAGVGKLIMAKNNRHYEHEVIANLALKIDGSSG